MKNLLIYISPVKDFSDEGKTLVKIQIDNSLDIGWKIEDIMLVTNFPYEYNGVKALVLDVEFYAPRPRSQNTTIVSTLFDMGLIGKDIYWVHDFDAYQLNPFTEADLELDGFDVGLTDFGWRQRWCMGSFFFKEGARDIFKAVKDIVHTDIEDETAITSLTNEGKFEGRIKRLNITYNLGMRRVEENWARATQPVKVLHFHPHYPIRMHVDIKNHPTVDLLGIFMYGKNGLGHPLMNPRLIKIFNQNGIK